MLSQSNGSILNYIAVTRASHDSKVSEAIAADGRRTISDGPLDFAKRLKLKDVIDGAPEGPKIELLATLAQAWDVTELHRLAGFGVNRSGVSYKPGTLTNAAGIGVIASLVTGQLAITLEPQTQAPLLVLNGQFNGGFLQGTEYTGYLPKSDCPTQLMFFPHDWDWGKTVKALEEDESAVLTSFVDMLQQINLDRLKLWLAARAFDVITSTRERARELARELSK
jgi:hypothetical protein